MRVRITFVGGPCDGRSTEVDEKDATRVLTAAPYRDGAIALNAETVADSDAMRATRRTWESYERDDEDRCVYRFVVEPPTFGGGASN